MRAAVHCHLAFHIQRKEECLIADSEMKGLSPDNLRAVIQLRGQYEQMVLGIVRQGRKEGCFQAPEARVAAYGVITMCTAAAGWFKPGGRLSANRVADVYADLILNGLSGPREPGSPFAG